jgi:hypothetical protein
MRTEAAPFGLGRAIPKRGDMGKGPEFVPPPTKGRAKKAR